MRNALVCVMLRQLEYHPGVLFLTTNKVRGIDAAIQSRLTLALKCLARQALLLRLLRLLLHDHLLHCLSPLVECLT